VGTPLELSLATEYLYLLELGGYRLSQVPEPMTEAFDKSQVSHFAKIILDEMLRIVQLLESESLLTLNLDALGESSGVLKEAIGKLLDLVSRFLDEQRPYAWLRAQMGETQQGRVEAIAQALPAMTESDANKIMQILDNVPTKQADDFVKALQEKKGDAAGKRQVLNDTYAGLDFDGMMIRIPKEVPDDPLLKGIAEKLRNFNCLCILENFGKLRKTFHDLVDEFRQANLFMHFAAKHPGMQHKAGVTMGGTFIIVYQRKGGAHTNGPDNAYRQADAGIDNNVVVADFYLPYLSYSVHPPIVFQMLNGEPAPEAVTLALQPDPQTGNSYSVRDNQPYSFTHSVVNGTLNGGTPANGVTPNGADHFAFTPSALKPRFNIDLKSIPLEFTYTKRGVTSQPVRITVYNEPMVTDVKPSAENLLAGAKVTITATVKFADTFRWMLEMFPATGSPRVVNDSLLTTKDVVNLTLAEAGTYVFTLEVTQSETKEKALSGQVKIFVRMAEQPAPKTCGSLPAIISDYGRIGIIDVKLFPDFNGILTELGINQFFKKLGNMVNDGEAALLAFFSREQDESSLAATLKGWLDRLASIILADKPKGFRPLAMEAYRIILALAMYVSCLRKEDITGEETELYKRMIVHMQGKGVIKGFMDISPEFGTKENKVLTGMRSTVGAEKKRLDSNNKLQEKPAYTKAIKALVAALNEPT
jgi:hypothetical protein